MESWLIYFIIIWALAFVLLLETILLIIIFIWTPARTFLKARFKHMPVMALRYKDFSSRFICAKRRLGNFVEVKGMGMYELVKGTGNFDINSKVIWYDCLTEQVATQSLYKAALITELRNIGYSINKWADLKYLMDCAANKEWVLTEYARLKKVGESTAEKFKVLVKNIRKGTVDIFTAKSYKVSELYNLFPNDYAPAYVDEASHLSVMLDRKTRNRDMVKYALVFVFLAIGAGVLYTMIKQGSPPDVVCSFTTDAITNATNMLQG